MAFAGRLWGGAVRFETTLQRPAEARGIGLHSGVPVSIRILPAPPSTGIVFIRTDLDNFPIPASWRYVARVSYATSLMRQGVLISTTEHLLSVFYSMGVDNAYVEIDNLEVPILDGSGRPYVELLRAAGLKSYRRRKRFLQNPPAGHGGSRIQTHFHPAVGPVSAHLRRFLRSSVDRHARRSTWK